MLELTRGEFRISTDPAHIDIKALHEFLSLHSGWARGIPLERVQKSVEHSLNFTLLQGTRQIGFARVISDCSTIAYLGDVYVLPEFRGQGLSKWLMQAVMNHPDLQGLRRWILLTADAHGLYQQYGWAPIANAQRYMEKFDAEVYTRV